MNEIKKLSRLRQDYLVSSLSTQIDTLQRTLNSIEASKEYDDEYVSESMKHVEKDMHRIRKELSE